MNPLPARDPSVVVSYIRMSSAEQGKAYGPASQRRAIQSFAKREGLTIAAEFHEDVSGTIPLEDRPGLRDALAAVYQHGAGALVVAERGRLARVAHDAIHEFAAAGAAVQYADGSNGDDDAAKFMDSIGHAVAAYDRRRIVARLKAGCDAKAALHPKSRAQVGKVPLGYRRTRTGIEVDPAAAAEVVRVFQLIRDGRAIRKVAETMSVETGRPWHPNLVDKIVHREIYKQNAPTPIIDARVWAATQAALATRRRH